MPTIAEVWNAMPVRTKGDAPGADWWEWFGQLHIAIKSHVEAQQSCVWTEDEDGCWATGCCNVFEFTCDGPAENGAKFCCYCGAPLHAHPFVEEDDDDDETERQNEREAWIAAGIAEAR